MNMPHDSQKRGKKQFVKPFLRNILLIMVSIIFALGVVEIIYRMTGVSPKVYRLRLKHEKSAYTISANPSLGYVLKKNYRDDNPDNHQSFKYTNAHGQRDIEREVTKPAGIKRIIILGDSVVAGNGVEDLNDTISRKLEVLLSGKPYEVFNISAAGYCTHGEVELLRFNGLRFDPDIVALVFVENDYVEGNRLYKNYTIERPELAEFMFIHSSLFRYIALVTNLYHFGELLEPASGSPDSDSYARTRYKQANKDGVNNVTIGLNLLKALSVEHGFLPLIVIWPQFSDADIYYKEFFKTQDGLLGVEAVAKGLDIPFFRLRKYFENDLLKRDSQKTPNELYTIGDEMHPSSVGAQVCAQAIHDILLKEGYFSK